MTGPMLGGPRAYHCPRLWLPESLRGGSSKPGEREDGEAAGLLGALASNLIATILDLSSFFCFSCFK